jgi:hypothetical protein
VESIDPVEIKRQDEREVKGGGMGPPEFTHYLSPSAYQRLFGFLTAPWKFSFIPINKIPYNHPQS